MKRFISQFYNKKYCLYSSHYSDEYIKITEHWQQCGGHIEHVLDYFYGDENTLAEFLLTIDVPVKFKEMKWK